MGHAVMISLGLLMVYFFIRMPIAIGMIISSTLYLAVKGMDPSVVVEIFTNKIYNNFILLTVPLLIFAAGTINSSKITDKIFDFSKVLVGQWEGGLGHVSIIASLTFSGMTDSAVADTSGLGITGIEAMRKGEYDNGFNTAIAAGSAVVGPISPPSIPLVVYGVITGASIGNLFLTDMVPGIILALALCIYVCYITNKRNYPNERKYAGTGFIRMMASAISALLTLIILLMGVYTGIMTATGAGVVATLCALPISIFAYRSITLPEFIQILKNMVKSTEQISIILDAAYVFSYVTAVENLPFLAGNLILSFVTTKVTFLIFVNIILFILGMLLDPAVLQLVLFPILCLIARSLEIDMVHSGMVFTLNTMTGLCTSSFSILLFIVTGTSGEKMDTIVKEVMPIVLVMVLVLILVMFVPDVIMWLPRLFGR